MQISNNNIVDIVHNLKHFLPSQNPLKDFIHHNTLHAFQDKKFFDALQQARSIFGYKTALSIKEFRNLYNEKLISEAAVIRAIELIHGNNNIPHWLDKISNDVFDENIIPKIGGLRNNWKSIFKINLNKVTHPILLRLVSNFLDQGIATQGFPADEINFYKAILSLEKNSRISIFKSQRARNLFLQNEIAIEKVLHLLVGDESLYEQYIFDQQFEHPGWSGMVVVLENSPETLLDKKEINLEQFIYLECLLELDALDSKFGEHWQCLSDAIIQKPEPIFAEEKKSLLFNVIEIFQLSFELTLYDKVLCGIQFEKAKNENGIPSFQSVFCIDDRECSLRRYIENLDPNSETFGTPGFFGVPFYFKPQGGKFYTKVCPAPVFPKHIIIEKNSTAKIKKDIHLSSRTHGVLLGWLFSQTIGFWSAIKLFFNIFKPTITPATSYSFRHMDANAELTIENQHIDDKEDDLQIGFTIDEMANCVENLLKSIGLTKNFSQLIYIVGHGASSVNNTHYAGYDCGACSGRPGSVNARVISFMANHKKVRELLTLKNIIIPKTTVFVGSLHDTTRDEIQFYDIQQLSEINKNNHLKNVQIFEKALQLNAKERSRRFELTNSFINDKPLHSKIKLRSVSLFEPRPELNHATNAMCIIGRRTLTQNLFLDRRSFLNSYDYAQDLDGKYLLNILNAAAPVCGGINLEYYFSRVDNYNLGAGTKLPHNVIGLIGVANGTDGDLRTGLPSQMIEVHDPVRLLILVEHYPETVLDVIKRNSATYEWFKNAWVNLAVKNPQTKEIYFFQNEKLELYVPFTNQLSVMENPVQKIISTIDNLEIQLLN